MTPDFRVSEKRAPYSSAVPAGAVVRDFFGGKTEVEPKFFGLPLPSKT
jgi:hypothetical protein